MPGAGRVAMGSLAGAIVAAICAPLILPLFRVPEGGVGFVTIHHYPKGWDYAVVALIVGLSCLGGMVASRLWAPGSGLLGASSTSSSEPGAQSQGPSRSWLLAILVFLYMLFAHDQPYVLMDMFHEGEHLTPAFVMRDGGRPFADIFHLHGLGADGGLDAMFMGDPPSLWRSRRMHTILNAATIALLVPVAAEVCVTATGLWLGVLLSMTALGAGQAIGFPYYRLAPIILATFAFLRYARSGNVRWLFAALSASTLGILWSLDTGVYAVGASGAVAVLGLLHGRRWPAWREVAAAAGAVALPFVVLLIVGADLGHFLTDSFVLIPSAIDAVWSLPASRTPSLETARYYGPPLFYGFLLAVAWRAPVLQQRQ